MPQPGQVKRNLINEPFERLVVTGGPVRLPRGGGRFESGWECLCRCGKTVRVTTYNLTHGVTRSCGCLAIDHARQLSKPGCEKTRKLSPEQKRQAIADYEAGKSCNTIAAELGVDHTSIWSYLKRRGVTLRSRSECNRTIPLNQEAFAGDLCDEAARWVGMLMTDGCVHRRPGSSSATISLALNEDDAGHVERFREFLGSGHKIDRQGPKGFGQEGGRPLVRLAVPSGRLADDLARFGVCPRKSIAADPVGGIESRAAFWAGAIDGDGHLMWDGRKAVLGLSGSLPMVTKFQAFVRGLGLRCEAKPQRQGNIYHLRTHGATAVRLAEIFYVETPAPLTRKQAVASRMIAEWASLQASRRAPCSVEGCGRASCSLGFCVRHYKRFRKYGRVDAVGSRWHTPASDGTTVATPKHRRRRRHAAHRPDGFRWSQSG